MSIDRRLRDGLRATADALNPDQLTALHAVERRARREQRRTVVLQLAAAAAAVVLLAVGVSWSFGQLRGSVAVAPPAPTPGIVGSYVVDVADSTLARTGGMVGRWVVRLAFDGTVEILPPDSFPGSRTGATYQVSGDQLRTNTFVNDVCDVGSSASAVGTYRWSRTPSTLRFTVVSDSCPARRLFFTAAEWKVA